MRCAHRTSGFTLVELLVVIFIVGIIATMATLSVGTATREKGLAKEVERIGDLVRLASEEAVLQNRELGLTFYESEYEFSYYDAEERLWVPLGAGSGPFEPREFPPETETELVIEGRRIALDRERPVRKEPPPAERKRTDVVLGPKEEIKPQILILSSGDVLPRFTVELRPEFSDDSVSITVSETGAVEEPKDARR